MTVDQVLKQSNSYPYLFVARTYGLSYRTLLILADWVQGESVNDDLMAEITVECQKLSREAYNELVTILANLGVRWEALRNPN